MTRWCMGGLALAMLCATAIGASGPLPWPDANEVLAEVTPPTFPAQAFNVTTYGAVGNGTTDNTAAFANAISACSAAGGGVVEVPAGTYVSGAIELLSNVNFQVDTGATIKFSVTAANFPLVHTRYQAIDLMNFSPMIHAANRTNVALTGHGVLDATSTSTWNLDGSGNFTMLENEATGGTPVANRIFGSAHPLRTAFVEFFNCSNVLIQGVTIQKSRFWQMHPCLCVNVTVDSVTTNSTTAQTDGCDVEACTGVVIKNCKFTAGDDCVVVKAGRNADQFRVHKPSQYVVMMNCTGSTPQGLFTTGSEMTDGIQHVYAYNISTFGNGAKYGLFMKSNTLRGGYAKDVHVDTMSGAFSTGVVFATMTYNSETGPNLPKFDNITLNNCTCTSAGHVADMVGLSNDHITNVLVSNSTFSNVASADIATNVDLTYSNVTINGSPVGTAAKSAKMKSALLRRR